MPLRFDSFALARGLGGSGLLLTVLLALPARAGSAGSPMLRWPLDRPPVVVSTFGEYRYDHMHAGLDLSTGGATGLPVLAAADGRIVRLKVEWRGYGRALYLRHADGRTSVYGHLERYEEATLHLESIVTRRRKESGTRYPGDIYIEPPLTVRRGQTIAYSGESGVGLPHLHFEIRDANDQPVDPFRAGLKPPADPAPPVLESIELMAAAPTSYIEGTLREKSLPLRRHGDTWDVVGPVRVTGPVRADLLAYVSSGGARAGVHSLTATLDGAPLYNLDLRSFRFDQYPLSALIFDHRLSHLGPSRYAYRIGRLSGNNLASGPPVSGIDRNGILDPGPGTHTLVVTARSAAGVERRARVTILVEAGRDRHVEPSPSSQGGSLKLQPLADFLDLRRGVEAGGPLGVDAPELFPGHGAIAWRALPTGGESGGIDYPGILPAPSSHGVTFHGGQVGEADTSPPVLYFAGTATAIRHDGDHFRIDLPPGGRFAPGPMLISTALAEAVPEGLHAERDMVEVLPEGEALNARATLSFLLDGLAAAGRLGIYRWDPVTSRWSFEGGELDPKATAVQLPFRRYGRFALLRDDAPPVVREVHPRGGSVQPARAPAISAAVDDVGEGLKFDGVSFVLDGAVLESEFDPDRGTARPFQVPTLSPGRHVLLVTATDRCGNRGAPIEVTFTAR